MLLGSSTTAQLLTYTFINTHNKKTEVMTI